MKEWIILIGIWIAGAMSGIGFGVMLLSPTIEECRAMVIKNIQENHQFEAEIGKQVNPDFLTELTKKGKVTP